METILASIFHFLLVQKNEPKKKTPLPFGSLEVSTPLRLSGVFVSLRLPDSFALLKAAGNFQTRFAQTVISYFQDKMVERLQTCLLT